MSHMDPHTVDYPLESQTSPPDSKFAVCDEVDVPTLQSPSSFHQAGLLDKKAQKQQRQQQHHPTNKNNNKKPSHRRSKKVAAVMSSGGDSNSLTKELSRGTPTDGSVTASLKKSPSQQEMAKKRSQYFDEVFASREPYNTPRHRVNQDSIVVVEIKTNIPIKDDFQVVSDIAFHLAQIFQRPENSILLHVVHNACLMLGLSYEPAYLATVSALPYLIAPVTNLRNTVLIQAAINDTLGIPSNRGVVKFEAMPEENFATNGATIKDEIEQLERSSNDEHSSVIKSLSRSMSRKIKSNSSHTASVTTNQTHTSPLSPIQASPSREGSPAMTSKTDSPRKLGSTGRGSVVRKCKSIKQLFFR
ncbi:hypothetical protein AJ80_01768 [Polytolypa hystricis UAMH7299]|uniref:L-dopachrome isomerase n=1 Tax=Polytolypa hystricis (strain UAMH7299) TaxID=1447883 RepID=A0A2B7YYQ9_POLH7|nr:hypothetical protein AJ80_01768 [Polytolypa hystricis UAMH7299]